MSRNERMELWGHPSCYFGFSPDQDYLLISVHRESDTVSESNWIVAQREMAKVVATLPPFDLVEEDFEQGRPSPRTEGWVYTWRATHCLVGWVEYMMIRGDAPQAIIDAGHAITQRLYDYPVLDDDHHSELEYDQIYAHWKGESLSWRIEQLAFAGDSIFAARRADEIPERTFDCIRDTWT